MKKPFAYITAVWKGGEFTVIDQAAVYCRKVYEAGFTPICPVLYLPHFLRDSIPAEHKDGIDIGRELLRRSHVLIVCGDEVDESVKNDIAVAQRLGITATTLDGMEHRMEQIAALKTHIINYAKTRNTYLAYRKTKAADKPAFRAAHETDLLLHEAAKRAFDALGVKKLPTVKVLQAEYTDLLAKKKAAYEDFKRLRQENQELQAVKSNVDSLLQIKQEEKKEQKQEKKQEQDR